MYDFQAALIDLDGTLVDSESLKALSLTQAVALSGGNVRPEIYSEVMGSDWQVVRSHFLAAANIAVSAELFDAAFRRIYQEALARGVAERAGARRFLVALKQNEIRTALVSSAARWMIEAVVEKNGFREYFDVVIGREDVCRHKPDPEAYRLAIAQLRTSADAAVVFEDSEAGVSAGCAAQCRVVAIRHGFNRSHDFSRAIQVIESFDDLRAVSR